MQKKMLDVQFLIFQHKLISVKFVRVWSIIEVSEDGEETEGGLTYRDASGRVAGSATTNGSSAGFSQTTYRDGRGRLAGSATTRTNGTSGHRTDFRDASGRSAGSQATNGSSGSVTGTSRDASGRVSGSSTGSGKCPTAVRAPVPPVGTSK